MESWGSKFRGRAGMGVNNLGMQVIRLKYIMCKFSSCLFAAVKLGPVRPSSQAEFCLANEFFGKFDHHISEPHCSIHID